MGEAPFPDAGENTQNESAAGTPRWLKVFGIIALALILLVAVLQVMGGGHGPSRHTPPSPVTEQLEPLP